MILILVNCVFLALENPYNSPELLKIFYIGDVVFTSAFTIEMILKIIGLGLYKTKDSYLRDSWNQLDCFVVFVSLLSFIDFDGGGILKAFRAVRPIRVIIRSKQVKVIVSSLWHAIPAITNVFLFCGLFWLIFGILGISFFGGKFHYCTDDSAEILTRADCTGWFIPGLNHTELLALGNMTVDVENQGMWEEREWVLPPQNFDNIGTSMRTLLQVCVDKTSRVFYL